MKKKKKTKDRKKAITIVWSCLHQHQPVMGSWIGPTTTPAANCSRLTLKPRRNLGTEMAAKLARSGKGKDTWVLKFEAAKNNVLSMVISNSILSVYRGLRTQLGDAAKISGQTESTTKWWKIMWIMRSSVRCRTTCCGTFLDNGNDQG